MANEKYYSVFTTKGLELLREAIQNGTKLGVTHMSFGDGNGSEPIPDADRNSLVNEVYRTQLNKLAPDTKNKNWLQAEAVIASAIGGFTIREVGLWANNILVAYANYPSSYKPTAADGTAKIMTIRIVLQIDNVANFELIINPDIVLATIQQLNDALLAYQKTVETIADLMDVTPYHGMTVKVLSRDSGNFALAEPYSGGGVFTFDQNRISENDGGTIFDGWYRSWDEIKVEAEWWGAREGKDATTALQNALNFISPTKWTGSVNSSNQIGGSYILQLKARPYIISDTIWVGAYSVVKGTGELGFNIANVNDASRIVADFSDPLKPAISSANWKKDGTRVPFNEKTTGAMYDNGLVSATHGIKLRDFSIVTATGKRCLIGLRLQNSPQSFIRLYTNGFDYGVLTNASWQSEFNLKTLHYKCGFLADFDSNGIKLDGYFNKKGALSPLPDVNFINFFTSDTDTDTTLNNIETVFGAVSRYSFGASGGSIICEHNDVGFSSCAGTMDLQTLYTEGNSKYSYVGYTGTIRIGNHVGHGDDYVYLLGANSNTTVDAYNKTGVTSDKVIKKLSQWNSTLNVPLNLNTYIRGIQYKNSDNTYYVSATSGSNNNSGVINSAPLSSVEEALNRITSQYLFSDKNTKLNQHKTFEIIILDNSDYTILGHNIYCDIYIKPLNSANKPTLTFNSYQVLYNSHITINNCNVVRPDINYVNSDVAYENGIFWSKNGKNTIELVSSTLNLNFGYALIYPDYNGCSELTLIMSKSVVNGTSAAQLIQRNDLNTSPHIINVISSQTMIDQNILTRPDKGISVPEMWKNKILGL